MERKGDESLYLMDRIWVLLVGSVMDEAHASRYLVHLEADKTYYNLGDMYCLRYLSENEIESPWILSLNFQGQSSEYDVIWVMVDRLTKLAYFLAIQEDFKISPRGFWADAEQKVLEDAMIEVCISIIKRMEKVNKDSTLKNIEGMCHLSMGIDCKRRSLTRLGSIPFVHRVLKLRWKDEWRIASMLRPIVG
ncbi:hypothetical protein Tco_0454222 [Tanacetum coccineum]